MAEEAAIASAPPAAALPRASTLAAFARALVLPFEHPLRLLLTGPLAAFMTVLVMTEGLYRLPLVAWGYGGPWLWVKFLLAIVLFVFWGCAWQRALARQPAEPMRLWLGRSIRQWPGYALAATVAIVGPALIWLFFFGMTYLIMAGSNSTAIPGVWWSLAGTLILLLPGLWLYGRLSFLPAVVAAQGWSGAVERALQLGRRRDFGLVVAFLLFAMIGFFLAGVASYFFVLVGMSFISMSDMELYAATIRISYLVGQTIALTLFGAWVMGFPALILRLETRAAEIDPAAFD